MPVTMVSRLDGLDKIVTGIRNWRIEAKDRDTWWKILENPRPLQVEWREHWTCTSILQYA